MFRHARLLGLPTFKSPPCPFIYFGSFFQIVIIFSTFSWFFPNFSEFFRIFPNFSWFFLNKKMDFIPCPFIMHIFSLPVYLILKKFLPCLFIRVCPFINFSENFNPARLLGTARLLGHSEYLGTTYVLLKMGKIWLSAFTEV